VTLKGRWDMTSQLLQLSKEFLALRATMDRHVRAAEEWEDAREAMITPTQDRMLALALQIAASRASTPFELAQKASVALDWINEKDGDISDALAASLCRDLINVFSMS
jgi:hypothetical protein